MFNRIAHFFATNVGIKAVAVVIALVLWVVVLGSRNVEVTKEVPLEVVTSEEVVPANDIPEKIAFRLSGPKAFLRAVVERREDPIRVNLTGAKPGLVTYRFFSDNIRLPIGVKVLSVSPTAILIKLERVRTKQVPVKVELRGTPPEGYRIASSEIEPSMVTIKGPTSRVAAVSEVTTMPIDVADLKESMEKQVAVNLMDLGVELVSEAPVVKLEVEADAANYRIRNVEVRVRSPHPATVSPESVTVLVKTSPERLKSLDSSKVYGFVDLSKKPPGNYTEKVRVRLPQGVSVVKVIPDQVEVTLGNR